MLSDTGLLPSVTRLSRPVLLAISFVTPWRICRSSGRVPRPRDSIAGRLYHCHGLGSSRFARRYSGNRCCFLFLRVLRWFTSPGRPPRDYVFITRITQDHCAGFPHSDIDGSRDVCSSPSLIAAYHVLPRLHAPRHPPCALGSLPTFRPIRKLSQEPESSQNFDDSVFA